MNKVYIYIFYFLFSHHLAQSQHISLESNIGVTDKPSTRGQTIGLGIDYHWKNFQIGFSYGRIRQNININPLLDGPDKGIIETFTDGYFERLENYYHKQEFAKRDAYYLNVGYRIGLFNTLTFIPRIGYGYTNQKEVFLIIDSSEPFVPHATYLEQLGDHFLWKFDFNLEWNVYKTLSVGLRYQYEDSFKNSDSIMFTLRVEI